MSRLTTNFTTITNGQAIPRDQLPPLPFKSFSHAIFDALNSGMRVAALFAAPAPTAVATLYAVLADDTHSTLHLMAAELDTPKFTSMTTRAPQLHLFEREIAEQFGIKPVGHPWLKPVRYRRAWHPTDVWNRPTNEPILPAVTDFYQVAGSQIHEVAVGPVHAGVIEPGHFRFQCAGEIVYHLEIALGYQHRGVEEALLNGPTPRTIHLMETLSGDSTIAHTTAYCQLLEALGTATPPLRAQRIRTIALELERLANHVGDLGALALDVGFLPTASFCGRLRGDLLNMTALLCGSRFGRGLVRPGGINFNPEHSTIQKLKQLLKRCQRDVTNAVDLLWSTQSVMARFEDIGVVPLRKAQALGVVGLTARASGLPRDVRLTHPTGIYTSSTLPIATAESGDVYARARMRWHDILHSYTFILEQSQKLLQDSPSGAPRAAVAPPTPNHLAVALCEGWRGEVCHVALTNAQGTFERYKVVDPSFHNWPALAYALRQQEISDFPICNKSFNLSYCGHDL